MVVQLDVSIHAIGILVNAADGQFRHVELSLERGVYSVCQYVRSVRDWVLYEGSVHILR